MDERTRVMALARHRARDTELLPLVAEMFGMLRSHEDVDLSPVTKRQVGIALRCLRKVIAAKARFQHALKRSLTPDQWKRVWDIAHSENSGTRRPR